MKYCPNCGESNQDESRFCRSCGKAFPQRKEQPKPTEAQPESTELQQEKALQTKIIVVGVLVVVFVAALLAVWFWSYSNKLAFGDASGIQQNEEGSDDDTEEVSTEISGTEEVEQESSTQVQEAAVDLSGIDLDGISAAKVKANGTVVNADGDYCIQFEEAVSIAGYNSRQEVRTVEDVEFLLLQGKKLADYENCVVEIEGAISFTTAGEVCLSADKVKVLEKPEGYEGHKYEFVIEDGTWWDAQYRAEEKGGYLVNINSEGEMRYLLSQIKEKKLEDKIFFLGARRESYDFDYYWVDEEGQLRYGQSINPGETPWLDSYWMSGEPSFNSDDYEECYVDMFQSNGKWVLNDIPYDIISIVPTYSGKVGYIIEYEE